MVDSEKPENPESESMLENVNPQSIEGLFLVALEKKTPAERTQFLDEMCDADIEKRRRVEALLMAYDDAGSFLEKPPVGSNEPQPVSLDFLTPSDNSDLLGTLGEYEIYELIGQGGMGIVFRALDPKLNRIVAIKVMSPHLAINANARKRFLREAQAAAAISHPHIVTIHAVDENKLPYLVMEYVAGQSLQEKLERSGSLDVTEILRIGQQISEGLAAAHKQGLIHRDIKPANILLENGVERVKITDFGLARAVDDVAITRTGEISGTPQYMSPEQAMGERVDQRSDLFSLGAVLYAMCTGRSPFRASNLAAVVRRVCDDVPRPIEEVNEAIPTWLCEIIDCLLEKCPEDRFQTAHQVAELLEAHLAIVQQPKKIAENNQRLQTIPKKQTESRDKKISITLKELSPVSLICFVGLAFMLGYLIASLWVLPSTPKVYRDSLAMKYILGVSLTLVTLLTGSSIVRWFFPGQSKVSFRTWFLSMASILLTLWLAFVMTAMSRAAPQIYTHPFGWTMLAVVLTLLAAVLIFAMRDLWQKTIERGPEYHKLMSYQNSLVLMSVGTSTLGFVFFILQTAFGYSRPQTHDVGLWLGVPLSMIAFAGGLYATVWYIRRIVHTLENRHADHSSGQQPILDQHFIDRSGSQEEAKSIQKQSHWRDLLAVWVGGQILLVPFILWGIRAAGGGHFATSVEEMVLYSLLFFEPLGLLVMIYGLQNMIQPESRMSKVLDGVFLLICFLLGPIGILLYIASNFKKPNARSHVESEQSVSNTSLNDRIKEEQTNSNKRVIIGVTIGIGLLLVLWLLNIAWGQIKEWQRYWFAVWGAICVATMGTFIIMKYFRAALNNPWKAIGWLVLSVPLFFIGLLVLFLMLPMFAVDSKDVVSQEIASTVHLTEVREEAYAPRTAMINANQGEITLDIQDVGLRVGIFPIGGKSTLPDEMLGYADRFSRKGPHVIPAGKYAINVSSVNAGWGKNGSVPTYTDSEIEVKAGVLDRYRITRNYQKLAKKHPNWSQGTLFQFYWPTVWRSRDPGSMIRGVTTSFTLSKEQALVVQQLLIAFGDGKPEVAELDLLATANENKKKNQIKSMRALFGHGRNPAWNQLIIPGKTKGTWQLIEPTFSYPNKKKMNPGDPFEAQNPFSLPPSPQGEIEAKKPRLESLSPFGSNVFDGQQK